MRKGLGIWPVGTGRAKEELFGWLRQDPPLEPTDPFPPGWCHFPQYPHDYFRMLCSEQLRPVEIKGGYRTYRWEKIPGQERNEALDCRVYARAAAYSLQMDRWGEETWAELEAELGVAPAHARQRARKQVGGDGRDHAEAQPPGERPGVGARRCDDVLDLLEHAARAAHQGVAGRRRQHLAPIALVEPDVEQRLELLHLRAEARLSHAARAGGGVEAPVVRNRDHVLELAQGRCNDHN